VDKSGAVASADPASFAGQSVAFPNLLSDDPNPTTAMAAIRGGAVPAGSAAGVPFVLPPGAPTEPPTAGDSLPVVPLPAQNYLSMSPVAAEPRDSLAAMAQDASTAKGEEVSPGGPGGFQLQVSSFRKEKTAAGFAARLRKRGHHAYIEAAIVPSKGTWYRVRVGPFKNRYEAMNYRTEFERREHIVSFLVEPPPRVTASRNAH
jgi:cell division septation protein DedD